MDHAVAPCPAADDARPLVPPQPSPQATPQPTRADGPWAATTAAGPRVPAAPRPAPGGRQPVRGAHPDAEAPPAPRRLPERHSVRDQVLGALRDALMAGELRPGAVYSAPLLAERFGVSATPVRESMQLLAREGLVEAMPNRGFRVAERTAGDLAELAEVRALLEVPVLLRLARSLPPERWDALRPLADAGLRAAAAGDRRAYTETDRAFHRALLELSGNRQLTAIADELHSRAQWPLTGSAGVGAAPAGRTAATDRLMADAREHTRLLDLCAAADLPAVERLLRRHLTGAP